MDGAQPNSELRISKLHVDVVSQLTAPSMCVYTGFDIFVGINVSYSWYTVLGQFPHFFYCSMFLHPLYIFAYYKSIFFFLFCQI